ncbi:MAG: hypothetical protein HDR24_02725 [Lachnospiraceae bacterium]|nr:hypothetical protein [Lachnospiraceae bacterium]
MGKKKEKKSIALKMLEKEQKMVDQEISEFYPDGIRADIESLSDEDPFARILSTVKKEQSTQIFTEEEMQEKCFQIRSNVKESKPDNIEINFVEGVLRFKGNKYELGSTVVKAVAMDASKPVYLHIKREDAVSSLVFIGGSDAQAFLVTKDDKKTLFTKLTEFHLLSISENSTPEREIGLMVSYSWIPAQVYFSIIMGYSLNPVKNLLLSDNFVSEGTENQRPMIEKEDDENEQDKDDKHS